MAEHKNSVYRKISEDIAAKIQSGIYPAGSMLEPERKLMEIYGVERTTIRRALEVLAKDGKIIKKTGLGSVVADSESIPVYNEKNAEERKASQKQSKKKLQAVPAGIRLKNDYVSAAAVILEKLAGLGHEKIMCVGKSDEMFAAVAGEAARLGKYDADLFVVTDERNTVDYMFERIWSSMRSSKPTAVIVSSQEIAEKVVERAERMRVSVPDELTVVALQTSKASGVCGCIFDKAETEKILLSVLDAALDSLMPAFTVKVNPVYVQGETVAKAKSSHDGFGSMSAYLL